MAVTKREQLLKAAQPQQILRFNECKALIEHFGFRLASINRLHNIYVHDKVPELISLQNVDGLIKPFQVRQILNLIYKHQLRASDEPITGLNPEATPS